MFSASKRTTHRSRELLFSFCSAQVRPNLWQKNDIEITGAIPAQRHQDGQLAAAPDVPGDTKEASLLDFGDKGKGLIAIYNSLVGGFGADGGRLFSEMHNGKLRGNTS